MKTTRCKHPNCIIKEHINAWAIWSISDSELVDDGVSAADSPSGMVQFTCYDCGLDKTFKRNKPKWLKQYMQQIASGVYRNGH